MMMHDRLTRIEDDTKKEMFAAINTAIALIDKRLVSSKEKYEALKKMEESKILVAKSESMEGISSGISNN